jgi:hypothetical protein
MARLTRIQKRVRSQKMLEGLKKHGDVIAYVFAASTRYATAAVIGILEAHLAAMDRADAAYAAWLDAVRTEQRLGKPVAAVAGAVKGAVLHRFGDKPSKMLQFGVKSDRKTGPKTVRVKARSAEKRRATLQGKKPQA